MNQNTAVSSQSLKFHASEKVSNFTTRHTRTLAEEKEADPLVVFVVLFFAARLQAHTRMRHLHTHHSVEQVRQRERRLDPAVRVHDLLRDVRDDARDGVAEELLGRHENGARDEQNEGGLVVKPEDEVVDGDLIELRQLLD
jgi:hypothetical protein